MFLLCQPQFSDPFWVMELESPLEIQREFWWNMLMFQCTSSGEFVIFIHLATDHTSHFVAAGLFTCRASLRWTNLAETSGCAANETCWCLVSPCEGLIFCNCSCSANYQPLPAITSLFDLATCTRPQQSVSQQRSVLGVETNVLRPPSDPPLKQVRMPLKVAGVLDLPVQTVGSSNSSEFFLT